YLSKCATDCSRLERALEHGGRSVRQDAGLAPLCFQRLERHARVWESIKIEIRIEQSRLQRFVDARHRCQCVVKRALGENPEIRVMPRKREGPAVFQLFRSPDRRAP